MLNNLGVMMAEFCLISRNSELALRQADIVKSCLSNFYPHVNIKIEGTTTIGDQILDKTLDKIGGKGLFIKELQKKLLDGVCDIAVHSLKDLPMQVNDDFYCAAILKRENPQDAFISNKYNSLESMPNNAIIGTSSSRRIAIIKHFYPYLQVKLLRGNLQTRLKKLDNHEYDAIILAVAGLSRLGLTNRIKQFLPVDKFVPAVGQGAIALEVLSKRLDLMLLLGAIDDDETFRAISIERAIGSKLGVDCSTPIGIHAVVNPDSITVYVFLLNDQKQPIFLRVDSSFQNQIDIVDKVIHEIAKNLKTTAS
jgi:hydroxymethylbilane synthase